MTQFIVVREGIESSVGRYANHQTGKALAARLLAATAMCIVYSAPAVAGDYGITSSNSDPVFVAEGDTVVGDKRGVYSDGTELNLTNEGTIRGNGLAGFTGNTDGGVVFKGGPAHITNSGDISGARYGISSFYYFTDFSDPNNPIWDFRAIGSTLDNSGSIIGDSDDGVRFIGGGTITNSGYIAGRVGGGADGISMFTGEGQPLDTFVGSVTNLAGGVIEGNRWGIIMSNGGEVDNAGTISGNAGGILLQAQSFDPGRTGTVTNSGTINGMVAFNDLASASVTNSGGITGATSGVRDSSGSLTVNNSGTIRGNGLNAFTSNTDGGITFNGGPADITNTGTITGARFGISSFYYFTDFSDEENPVWDFRAAGSTLNNSGTIIGDSDDGVRFIGGGTITNSGYIAGRVGGLADGISMFSGEGQPLDSFDIIGSVNNLVGGVIEGNRFGIILSNGGSVDNAGTISGNSGGILIQAPSFDTGRTGTVNNSGAINGTVSFAGLESGSVTNSGAIAGATSGVINYSTSLSVNNTGTIRANGTYDGFDAQPDAGVSTNGGPATITNSGTISGARFGITTAYFWNDAVQQLEGRAIGTSVVNSGSIIGDTDIGIRLIGGGSVTNSGYIAGRLGQFADGIWMMAYNDQPLGSFTQIGTVTNLAGGVIEGNRRGVTLANGGTVNNAGTISGVVAGIRIVALLSDPGRTGTVTNSGTINGAVELVDLASGSVTNTGNITGSNSGVRSTSAALSVNNGGAIRGNGLNAFTGNTDAGIAFSGGAANITNTGTITGARFGVSSYYYFSDPDNNVWDGRAINSTLVNSGTIIGDSDDGVRFIGGGTVTNSGIIRGLVGSGADGVSMFAYNGQNTAGVTSIGTVNNLAGGTIQGNRFAIILSGGGTINNAGVLTGGTNGATLIQGAGGVGTMQNSGTINGSVNFADLVSASLTNSGAISANYLAVSTNGNLNVTNLAGGIINGLNQGGYGAGIYQTGNSATLSLNNAGTITGYGDGAVFANANIQNSGSIIGTTLVGLLSSGGTSQIMNSGTVSGALAGILTNGPSSITNTGQITGGQYGASLAAGGTITNSGTIFRTLTSGGGAAVSFANGGTLNNAGVIGGNKGNANLAVGFAASAPGKTATIVNDGKINGRVVIAGVDSANITINSAGRIDLGTGGFVIGNQAVPKAILSSVPTTLTIAGWVFEPIQLSDSADTVILQEKSTTSWIDTRGGQDVVQLTGTTNSATKANRIPWLDGVESLQLTGSYWYLSSANTPTFASTTVTNGTLELNPSFGTYTINSPVTVNAGGSLASQNGGILGNLTVNNGGAVSPGGRSGAISTLNVTGNVAFNAGSNFIVDTTPTPNNSDRLNVTGTATINLGAKVQVLAGKGKYTTSSYTILTTTGGITGSFGSVTTDMAFLLPEMVKDNNSIVLTLVYNKKPLTTAATASTFGVANTISTFDQGNAIYDAVLFQSLEGASQAFDSLSGGGYGRLDAALADSFGKAKLKLDDAKTEAPVLRWSEGNSLAAAGLKSGFASSRGPISFGAVAGHYFEPIHAGELSGDADTYFFGGMVGYRAGRFQSVASLATASHDVAVTRAISFPGFADGAASRYRARTSRLDLEGSYALANVGFTLAPYGGYSRLMLKTKAFNEQGGVSALSFGSEARVVDEARLGVRMASDVKFGRVTIAPHLDASIERAWGDLDSKRDARFGFGSQEFDSIGSSFNSRSALIDAGVELNAGALSVGAGYRGQFGDQWNDQSARLSAALRF